MAVKNYCTMNGQLIGEYEGTRSTDYILDGLGSVIATFRSTGTIQNQYRYSGYGQQVYRSGTGTDPYFLWVGGWGYRTRGMVYVRRRVFYEDAAVWTSVDPLWPDERAYGYAGASPAVITDVSGYSIHVERECECSKCPDHDKPVPGYSPMKDMVKRTCEKLRSCWFTPACKKYMVDCVNETAPGRGEEIFKCVVASCNAGRIKADVKCGGWLCTASKCGYANWRCNIHICTNIDRELCGYTCKLHHRTFFYAQCEKPKCDAEQTLVHELGHCCGTGAHVFGNTLPDKFEECWIGKPFP